MSAMIIAESSGFDLSPLTDRTPHPLLPLTGKSLLLHALEAMHRTGIRDVEVVSPSLHKQLEAATDTRPLLGMQVRFTPRISDPTEPDQQCLVTGLQVLADIDWEKTIRQINDSLHEPHLAIRLMSSGETFALLLSPGFDGKVSPDWYDNYHTEAIQLSYPDICLVATHSLAAYYDANINLVNGTYRYLKPAGRDITIGHRASPKARVHAKSMQTRNGYFGSNSKVDKTASLFGSVVLGNNVVVDKGARVTDSIIFDSTYIGANTDCSEAIISGNVMIKARTGVCLELNDPVLFDTIA